MVWIGAAFAYLDVAGTATHRAQERGARSACHASTMSDEEKRLYYDEQDEARLAGLIWPIYLPISLGIELTERRRTLD